MAYDGSSIKRLEGLEIIRRRPTIYAGDLRYVVSHMVLESLDNVVDEFLAGAATVGRVVMDSKNKTIEVIDNGRGIPIWNDPVKKDTEALEICSFVIHGGGKLDNTEEDSGYEYSVGVNGVGAKINAALSNDYIVESYRDNHKAVMSSYKGEINRDKTSVTEWTKPTPLGFKRGTRIKFQIDSTIIKADNFEDHKEAIMTSMKLYASINPGLRLELIWDGKKISFYDTRGLKGLLVDLVKRNKSPLVTQDTMEIKFKCNYGGYHALVSFSSSGIIESFVNTRKSTDHGVHVSTLTRIISRYIQSYIRTNNLLSKKDIKTFGNINLSQVQQTIVAIVTTTLVVSPEYTGQTKKELTNSDYDVMMGPSIKVLVDGWFQKHPAVVESAAKITIKLARAAYAAKEASNNIISGKPSKKKQTIHDIDVSKFTDCASDDPNECEIFLTEGDSAGDNVAVVRNSNNQAVFRFKGKSGNVIKGNKLNEEYVKAIETLGCGYGNGFDLKKIRFTKIIILTDADVDGSHIKSLLYAFFTTKLTEIVEAGYLYIAIPPLYTITTKTGTVFIHNNKQLVKYNFALMTSLYDLVGADNKPLGKTDSMSKQIFREYMRRLQGYALFIEQIASPINVPPELLELMCFHFDKLMAVGKNDFKIFNRYGYEVSKHEKFNSHTIHIEFNKGFDIYPIVLDKNFYNKIYKPILQRLKVIQLFDVHLVGKQTSTHYSDISYNTAKIIDGVLTDGKGVEIQRNKGLGEMDPEDLAISSVNPETRVITQITMGNKDEVFDMLDILFGSKRIEEKKVIFGK